MYSVNNGGELSALFLENIQNKKSIEKCVFQVEKK